MVKGAYLNRWIIESRTVNWISGDMFLAHQGCHDPQKKCIRKTQSSYSPKAPQQPPTYHLPSQLMSFSPRHTQNKIEKNGKRRILVLFSEEKTKPTTCDFGRQMAEDRWQTKSVFIPQRIRVENGLLHFRGSFQSRIQSDFPQQINVPAADKVEESRIDLGLRR